MATIKDVAKLAGVSPSAVSKYFISPDHMREKTKLQIAAAVEELNYHPNSLARSLRNGCSGVVAITVPDARNPHFGRYIHLMQDICFRFLSKSVPSRMLVMPSRSSAPDCPMA